MTLRTTGMTAGTAGTTWTLERKGVGSPRGHVDIEDGDENDENSEGGAEDSGDDVDVGGEGHGRPKDHVDVENNEDSEDVDVGEEGCGKPQGRWRKQRWRWRQLLCCQSSRCIPCPDLQFARSFLGPASLMPIRHRMLMLSKLHRVWPGLPQRVRPCVTWGRW